MNTTNTRCFGSSMDYAARDVLVLNWTFRLHFKTLAQDISFRGTYVFYKTQTFSL